LEPLGIGTERVLEACKDAFPDMPQFIVDSSHTKTHKQASSTIEKFYSTHGGILIGTEMALPYLTKPIEKSAVISIDTLLSLPHWNIHEKVFATLIRIRAITNESIHIQTRMPEQTVLEHAAGGSVADFYRHEVEERKRLLYPPFTTIITITREGTKAVIAKDIKIFEKLLSEYSPHIFPTRGNTKGAYRLNTILKIPRGVWVSKPLEARLADLPPQYIISVNPDSVL
jgi:primosomal protein N'|tara:strand:- start:216 stop:899 length:684 start_codon:yes stop_codon:yes gene_type:complete